MSAIEHILGKDGDSVQCNNLMHWWVSGAKRGDRCLCGKKIKGQLTAEEFAAKIQKSKRQPID